MVIPEKEHLYKKLCSSAENLEKCDFLKIKYWTYNKYKIIIIPWKTSHYKITFEKGGGAGDPFPYKKIYYGGAMHFFTQQFYYY